MLAHAVPVQTRPTFLAADVGGTHVRVGLVGPGRNGSAPHVLAYAKYRCAEHAGLADILAEFLGRLDPGRAPAVAVIASAGYPLDDGSVIAANLPWPLVPARIREQLQLQAVHLVNDFEAVAHAVSHLDASEVLHVCGPRDVAPGPLLVLGPGTGLGAAVWIPTAAQPVVLATEAGQAALAVATDLEMALLRQMQSQGRHVSIEQALSGPGLLNLYRALCALRDAPAVHDQPAQVTAAAMSGTDPLARESLDVFCGLLGSAVGDMALMYGARGVYLAGGILPHLRGVLEQSQFVERFLDKGPMRGALEQVVVRVVEHGQLGVIGAATWYLGSESVDA